MKRPMTVPAAGIAAGIITAFALNIDVWLLIGLGAVSLTAMIVPEIIPMKRGRFGLISVVTFFAVIGAIWTNNSTAGFPKLEENKKIKFAGIVEDVSNSIQSNSVVVNIDSANGVETDGKVLIKFYEKKSELEIGEKIYFNGMARKPSQNTNPGFFNYQTYLKTQGISYLINGDKADILSVGYSEDIGYKLKKNVVLYISEVFDEGLKEENASFMKGLLLGDSNYLDEEEYIIYRDMGLAHLLAVSGLHIGIIAGGLIFVMSRLGIKRELNVAISILIIVLYGYVIGFPPSTARGIIMFAIFYAARLLHRPADPLNILLASFCISLAVNPLWIFSSGFQLSYSAAASLILLTGRIKILFYPEKGKLVDGLSAVLSVNLGILPIQAYLFNRFPLIAILSNLIIVPLATASLVLGIVSLGAKGLLPVLDLLLNIQRELAYFTAAIPAGVLRLPTPSIAEALIYLFLLTVVFNWRIITSLERDIKNVLFAFLILSTVCGAAVLLDEKPVEIDFVDVGQGDCALVKTSSGNYLIDAGGSLLGDYDVGEKVTLPYLEKQGIRELDAVFITHRHEDHYEGLIPVADVINIGVIFINGIPPEELAKKAVEESISIVQLENGKSADFGNNVTVTVVWPQEKSIEYLNENNNSLVMLLEVEGRRILFTGDIEADVEKTLLKKYNFDTDLLKVSHHGSKTSTSEEFIKRFLPEYSIISVGKNNMFGHPDGDVVKRLEDLGSKVYRTDEMGMIRAQISRDNITIEPFIRNSGTKSFEEFMVENFKFLIFFVVYIILSLDMVLRYYSAGNPTRL